MLLILHLDMFCAFVLFAVIWLACADGRSVITKQHDCHVWVGSFVHNIPVLNWLYEVPFR